MSIPGYALVSRRDRSCQSNRGGIASFARHDVRNIVSIGDSEVAERSWHLLHTDLGSIAIVNWYRPGAAPLSHIESFAAEYEQYRHQFTSIIVAGDLNIHHRSWLRYSSGESYEGQVLKEICDSHSMQQIVKAPTHKSEISHNDYLSISCLTHNVEKKLESSITDHTSLHIPMSMEIPEQIIVPGEVWHCKGAS